jgi:hypothetical protein
MNYEKACCQPGQLIGAQKAFTLAHLSYNLQVLTGSVCRDCKAMSAESSRAVLLSRVRCYILTSRALWQACRLARTSLKRLSNKTFRKSVAQLQNLSVAKSRYQQSLIHVLSHGMMLHGKHAWHAVHIINQTSLDSATHATVPMGCWACQMLQSDCGGSSRTVTTCCCNRLLDIMQGLHGMLVQEAGLRRGKVLAAADQFAQLVGGVVETLVGQSVSAKGLLKQGSETISEPVVRRIPLPPSIIANAEPFRHGDWRKEPYPTRQDPPTRLLLAHDWSYVLPTSYHCNCFRPKARSSTAIVCCACNRGSKCQCRS